MPEAPVSSWMATFTAFRPGRMSLGPIAVHVSDWSRPQAGTTQIFEAALVERLLFAGPAAPLIVYVPSGAALVWYAARHAAGLATIAAAYALGLLGWTAFEYVMHRFVFHYTPSTRVGVVVQYVIHGVHHAFPNDDRRWMIPIVASVPIAAVIVALASLAGPAGLAWAGGFLHAYLVYDVIHHQVHRTTNTSRWVRALRAQHMRHHYQHPDREFGVSSPVWDVVFGTVNDPNRKER